MELVHKRMDFADNGFSLFGEKVYSGTACILVLLGLLLIVQTFNTINRIQDASRWRFLLLIFVFIVYTFTSIYMPDSLDDIETMEMGSFAFGRGIILGTFFTYYMTRELSIQEARYFNVKWVILACTSTFIISILAGLLHPSGIRAMITTLRYLPIWISIYFTIIVFIMLFRRLNSSTKHPTELWSILLTGYLGIVFVSAMTISVAFDDLNYVNIILTNIGLLFTSWAYFMKHFYQVKIEREWLEKMGIMSPKGAIVPFESTPQHQYGLTPRELEIVTLVVKGLKYEEIAEELFIAPKTVSKHASNVFKKCNVKNKEQLMEMFSS